MACPKCDEFAHKKKIQYERALSRNKDKHKLIEIVQMKGTFWVKSASGRLDTDVYADTDAR